MGKLRSSVWESGRKKTNGVTFEVNVIEEAISVVSFITIFLGYIDGFLLCVFTFWGPCCHVRSDVRIITMFGSSLPPVVCNVLYLSYMYLFAYGGVKHILLCVIVFFVTLRLVYPMLQVSNDCHFFIAPLVFSIVYFPLAKFG